MLIEEQIVVNLLLYSSLAFRALFVFTDSLDPSICLYIYISYNIPVGSDSFLLHKDQCLF